MYNSPSGIVCFDPAGLTKLSTFCPEKSIFSGVVAFSPWLDTLLLPWRAHITKCKSLQNKYLHLSCSLRFPTSTRHHRCSGTTRPCSQPMQRNGKVTCSGFTSLWKITKEDSRGPCPAGFHRAAQPLSCLVSTFWSASRHSSWANAAWEGAQMRCGKLRHKQN